MSPSTSGGPLCGDHSSLDTSKSAKPDGLRVLVVEDDWLVSMEIKATLEATGYAVVGIAVSAEEAVQLAVEHKPDLVTMDIRLKGSTDGVDAAVELNQRFGLRCLFVSAYSDQPMKDRASASKPLGWLAKPFSERQLVEAMATALRKLRH